MKAPCYPESEILTGGADDRCVTFAELTQYRPKKLQKAKYPQIYRTLPQDVNLTEIIAAITTGRTVRVVSLYLSLKGLPNLIKGP